jgi:hypothetical protein
MNNNLLSDHGYVLYILFSMFVVPKAGIEETE